MSHLQVHVLLKKVVVFIGTSTSYTGKSDFQTCISTELHGRMISVEKAKSESESSSRRQPARPERRSSKDRKEDAKDKENEVGELSSPKAAYIFVVAGCATRSWSPTLE